MGGGLPPPLVPPPCWSIFIIPFQAPPLPHAPDPYRMAIIWVSPHGSNMEGTTIMSHAA